MLRTFLSALLFLLSATASRAEWVHRSGEDPMTDLKWVVMYSPIGQQWQLSFKCWKGGNIQILVLLGQFNHNSPKFVTAKLRIDRTKPVELILKREGLAGRLVYVTSSAIRADVIPLLKRIGTAKNRVILGLGTDELEADASGAARSVQTMLAGCAIPLG